MFKKSKGRGAFIAFIITILLAGLYNLILYLTTSFTLPVCSDSFWISYGFFHGAILLTLFSYWISSIKSLNGKVAEIPIVTLAWIYLCIEFILSSIFYFFPSITFNAVFIPQVIVLVLIMITFIPALFIKNGSLGAERKEKNSSGKRVYHYQEREMADKENKDIAE